MKKLILAAVFSLLVVSQAHAALTAEEYQCIADYMNAVNSDVYSNLQPAEIDAMIQQPEHYGHDLAIEAQASCMRD